VTWLWQLIDIISAPLLVPALCGHDLCAHEHAQMRACAHTFSHVKRLPSSSTTTTVCNNDYDGVFDSELNRRQRLILP
jgi:hypothetical protein